MRRAAVIGLGIGMAHVAGYLKSEDATLYAVCDLIEERLSKVGGTFSQGSMLCLQPLFDQELLDKRWEEIGVICYRSIEEVLCDPMVDIVSICTPDYLHVRHLIMAMEHHKDILLEKPIALHVSEADTLLPLIAAYEGRIALGYEFRVVSAIRKIRELLAEDPTSLVEAFSLYHFRTPFRRDKWMHWIEQEQYSGGLIVEETCHWFDLARYLTGKEADSIHCVTTDAIHDDFDYEDIAYINGSFKGGGIFQISHALSGFDFSLQITVHRKHEVIWCGLKEQPYSSLDNGSTSYHGIVSRGRVGGTPDEAQVWTFAEDASEPVAIRELVCRFTRCIAEDLPFPADVQDGYQSLRMAEAARISARESRIVQL
ncbi:MAG: Gfo/Idh/MocA family oxidoreductase [Spirochaetia bacterium]|nr:Gfo/Idh/MocA family oxidoreductase [Spirochaetia bacterium]